MRAIYKMLVLAICVLLTLDMNAQVASTDSTSLTLREATVKKKLPKPEYVVNERYASRGAFANMMNVKVLDFINHPPANIGIPIMDYLMGKIPGLQITPSAEGYTLKSTRVNTYTNDDGGIKLFLDEQETSADFLSSLQPKDIALVKYFPPGGAMASAGASSAGMLSIYTRKGQDLVYYKEKQ